MKKFLSIVLVLTMLFSVSATALAAQGKSNENNRKSKNHTKVELSIEQDDETYSQNDNSHGKKGENLKKAFKMELNEHKKELQQQKTAICAEKEQLEEQYEELLASGDVESADALLEEIESLNSQIDLIKAEIRKAINERYMVVKTLYSDEELAQFDNASELISQMYEDAATLDAGSVSVKNNLIKFDAPPYIKGGVTLIPVRAITEQLGCEVSWDSETRTATIAKDNVEIKITIGSTTVYVDGNPVELNTAAEITCGRTFLPLRFIAETMGLEVSWDGDNRVIDIDDPDDDIDDDDSVDEELEGEDASDDLYDKNSEETDDIEAVTPEENL